MPYKADVTLTSKGQLTLPAKLRKLWGLKAGDCLAVEFGAEGKATISRKIRRSILESREELAPLSLGRPLTQQDIDDAVMSAMLDQEHRIRRQP